MGKIKPRAESSAHNGSTIGAICAICHVNMTLEYEWEAGTPVFHCEGLSRVGVHHNHRPTWGNCWKCAKPLGCVRCAAHTIAEAFCRRCGVWGTKEALTEQGLLGGQTIEDYPTGWHHDYFAARSFHRQGAPLA